MASIFHLHIYGYNLAKEFLHNLIPPNIAYYMQPSAFQMLQKFFQVTKCKQNSETTDEMEKYEVLCS